LMNSGETDEMRGVKNNDLDKISIQKTKTVNLFNSNKPLI